MKPSRVAEVLGGLLDTRWPAFVWGAPGVGKSSVVRAVAEARGLALVDVRAPLLDPTDPLDDPRRHLLFRPTDGEFDACGPRGPESIRVFGLNDRASPRKLPQGRRATLVKLQLLIRAYDDLLKRPDAAGAALHRQIMLEEPFSAVLFWLVEFAAHPDAALFLAPDQPKVARNTQSGGRDNPQPLPPPQTIVGGGQ